MLCSTSVSLRASQVYTSTGRPLPREYQESFLLRNTRTCTNLNSEELVIIHLPDTQCDHRWDSGLHLHGHGHAALSTSLVSSCFILIVCICSTSDRVISLRVLCVEKPKHSLIQNLGSLAYYAICTRITHISTSVVSPCLFGKQFL